MNGNLSPLFGSDTLSGMSVLGLAHVGDCVYELMARTSLCRSGALTHRALHASTVEMVCAGAQAEASRMLLPCLTAEERGVFMRGRNAKPHHIPKNANPAEYSLATALEALFGYLYLSGRQERLEELFGAVLSGKTGAESC